jgi:hypothetical protein
MSSKNIKVLIKNISKDEFTKQESYYDIDKISRERNSNPKFDYMYVQDLNLLSFYNFFNKSFG